jgi:hypothetical protein
LLWRFTPRDHWRGLDFKNVAGILRNSAETIAERYGHAREGVQREKLKAVAPTMPPFRPLTVV